VAAIVTLLMVAASCSEGSEEPRTEAATPSSEASPTAPSDPGPTESFEQPLALAVNVHRPPLDLRVGEARRIVAGESLRWSDVGQSGARIRVRRDAGALDAVARDPDVLAVVPAATLGPTVQAATVAGVDPLRAPARYPLTAPASRPVGEVATVTVAGDIMLGRGVGAAHPGDPGAPLRPLADRLRRADLTVGNLESTLSDDGVPRQGDDSFAADPAVVGALAAAGFDLLSLANNHTGDYGSAALRQTLRRIQRSPIRSIGAGVDAAAAWRPVVLRAGDLRIGFVAFNAIGETPRATAGQPGAAEVRMPPRTGPLDRGDLRRLTDTIERLSGRTDVVIAMPHWGDQYTNVPEPAQRRVGAAMIDAGATLVVGGHPHWVQGIQTHRDRLVVHSLGNFVFDMDFSSQTEEGVLLELVFWGSELMGARYVPYVIGADYVPRRANGPRAEATMDRLWSASDPPFDPASS
jgi:poly-gamma-glutamate capsule biosynthesis protein CapA/YwtB (metallophosphatase superfamily)